MVLLWRNVRNNRLQINFWLKRVWEVELRTKPPPINKKKNVHKRNVTFYTGSVSIALLFSISKNVNVIIAIMAYVRISYSLFFCCFTIRFFPYTFIKWIDNCQPNRNDWMIAKFQNFSLSPHLIWHEKFFFSSYNWVCWCCVHVNSMPFECFQQWLRLLFLQKH